MSKSIRILVMGLPGAGKTTLSTQIVEKIKNAGKTIAWLNADEIRKKFDDWDFSIEGRIRQSVRMRQLADDSDTDYVICDFVAPLIIFFVEPLITAGVSGYMTAASVYVRPRYSRLSPRIYRALEHFVSVTVYHYDRSFVTAFLAASESLYRSIYNCSLFF